MTTCNHHWHACKEQKGCGPELQVCCRCDATREVVNRNSNRVCQRGQFIGRAMPDYDWDTVRMRGRP